MEQFEELNLKRLVEIIFKHISMIIAVTLITGILSIIYSETMIVPEYESKVTIYVSNKKPGQSSQINSGDIATSQMLVDTYVVIIKSDRVLSNVAKRLEEEGIGSYHPNQLRTMITAESVDNTEVLEVTVRDTDRVNTFMIANILAEVAPDEISYYLEGSSVKVVDYASAGSKVSPNIQNNMIIGLALGLLLSCIFVVLKELFDMRIKNEDELEQWFKLPILGIVPDISDSGLTNKTGYYSYRRTSKAYEYTRKGAKENG